MTDVYGILESASRVFVILLAVGFLLLAYRIFSHVYRLFPARRFPEAKANYRYAIVIPARNESRVIEGLLGSIRRQDYPAQLLRTFVIVESADDPTCGICSKYENTEVFIRPDIEVKTKGGGLKQFFSKMLAEENGFAAYFIFDADNVLTPGYVTEMNKAYDCGYKICTGYRNSKNWNDGWLAACSAAFFLEINSCQNKLRSRFFKTSVLTGTGYYIAHEILGGVLTGCSFETLTEDLEVSIYAALNGVDIANNESAEFFDEQTRSMRESRKQRVRWLRGYHQNARLRIKLMKNGLKQRKIGQIEMALSALPIFFTVAAAALYTVFTAGLGVAAVCAGLDGYIRAFLASLLTIASAYLFLILWFLSLILVQRRRTNLKFRNAARAAFLYPVYLFLFIPYYVYYFFKKDAEWTPVEHTGEA